MLTDSYVPLRAVSMRRHLCKTPIPAEEEALNRIHDPHIIPRRQNGRAGNEHRRDRTHDELLAPWNSPAGARK